MAPEAKKSEPVSYRVVSAACPYRKPDGSGEFGLGMQNRIIVLDDDEALRLLMLEAIVAATPEEVEAENARQQLIAEQEALAAAGPVDNPYGGTVRGNASLEAHAAEQIALAHGKKPKG